MRILASLLLLLLTIAAPAAAQDASASPGGKWTIDIQFCCGKATHTATIVLKDSTLSGTYKGSLREASLRGTVRGDTVSFNTNLRYESADAPFRFTGTLKGDVMEGEVNMGEYWTGKWTAKKVGK